MTKKKHSILIIDDHPIIHDGLKTMFAPEADLEIIGGASSAGEALEKLEHEQPDIAIVDLSMGDSDGTYLIQRLKHKHPKLLMLVYSMSEEQLFAERTAIAGANGYVMKTSQPATLKKAIRTVLAGNLFFSPEVLRRVQKKAVGRGEGPQSVLDLLSNREMDIFKLIGQGFNTASIAAKLDISRNTVDTHRINIKNKLEQPNAKALDRLAYEVIQQGKLPET